MVLMALTQQAQLLLENGQEAKARGVSSHLKPGPGACCNPSSAISEGYPRLDARSTQKTPVY